jgi:hypothetical protein
MLVLFRPSPQSIIKAFLASRVHKAKPVEESDGKRYYFEDSEEAEKLDYDSIYGQYKEQYGGLDFLEDAKLWEILEDEIFWASRFNSLDRVQLIFKVLAQIEKSGTKPYLGQQSAEAKEMKDRVRRVTGEFRRARQFLAFFADDGNKAMIAKGVPEHRIVDLVLRHFAVRYPGYSIVLLDEQHAHILYKDEVLVDDRKKFPERPGRRDSSRYWTLLTDSRILEAKKDKDYIATEYPRNYWKWISEGVQSLSTTPNVTLDSFAT